MVGNSIQFWGRENLNIVGLDYTTDMIYTLNTASLFDTKKTYTRFYATKWPLFSVGPHITIKGNIC